MNANRKKDKVLILAGKDRGKQGEVVEVLRDAGRVLVAKLNLVKRHTPCDGADEPAGIREKESAAAHLERHARLPEMREGDAPQIRSSVGRHKGAGLPEMWRDDRFMSKTATVGSKIKERYTTFVIAEMMKRHSYANRFQVPRLQKVVVSMGVNDAREDIKSMDVAAGELTAIAGQKPQVRRAKKSISNFKLREGMPIGLRVTLRGTRMFEFLDRFITAAVPRIRDFRGLDPKAFDGQGNYNLGLNEQHIFPEVQMDKSPKVRGMNITIVTTAEGDDSARDMLQLLGFPFKAAEKDDKK